MESKEEETDASMAHRDTRGRVVDRACRDPGPRGWRTHVADPVPAAALPCGNITPTVGITGTPAYDAATGQVFAVATTQGLTSSSSAPVSSANNSASAPGCE